MMKYRPIVSHSMDSAPLENIMGTPFYRCMSDDWVMLFFYDKARESHGDGRLSRQDLLRLEGKTFREARRLPDVDIVGFQKGTFYPLVAHLTDLEDEHHVPYYRVDFGAVGLDGPQVTIAKWLPIGGMWADEPLLHALQVLRDRGVTDRVLGQIPMRSVSLASWRL